MDLSTDNVISIVGIALTAIFSLLVWLATRATAKATKATVAVAEETLRLNERLATAEEERDIEYRLIRKAQIKSQILSDFRKSTDALASTNPMVIFGRLQKAPVRLSVSDEDIATYFKKDEAEIILNSWRFYENFREKHFRSTYPGNEINVLTEKGPGVIDKLHMAKPILM